MSNSRLDLEKVINAGVSQILTVSPPVINADQCRFEPLSMMEML